MYDYELLMAAMAAFAGLFVFGAIVSIVVYVLFGISHMKALRMMGYDKAWAAWIPFFSSYALADCIPETKENIDIFGISIPGNIFKFWWILSLVVVFVPKFGTLLSTAVTIICAGLCYTSIYSILEGKSKDEVKVVGYLSGWINIIAIVKFFTYKN